VVALGTGVSMQEEIASIDEKHIFEAVNDLMARMRSIHLIQIMRYTLKTKRLCIEEYHLLKKALKTELN
jgi:hypothetical protein